MGQGVGNSVQGAEFGQGAEFTRLWCFGYNNFVTRADSGDGGFGLMDMGTGKCR